MLLRIIIISTIFFSSEIIALTKDEQPVIDSLFYIVHNEIVKNNSDKFRLFCLIAENSTDADTILHYSERAIQLAKKFDENLAKSILLNGDGYLMKGNHDMALEKFMQAAKLYKQDKNNIGLATTYGYISSTYSSQQNYRNAIIYLKKAINIFNLENDSERLASAQHNLGYAYYKIKQNDSALILYNKSKNIYQQIGYEKGYAYCLGNEGLVYSDLHKFNKAKELLLNAIDILKKYNDDYAIGNFLLECSIIQQNEGKTNEAIDCAIESYNTAKKNNLCELKRDATYRLSQLYNSIGQHDSAFYYQSAYIAYSDSIRNLETIQKMADLRTEFEVSQKQSEVDMLEKGKTIQLIVIGGLILIILLAGGLIYVYYLSLKRVKKFTGILDERRKLLEKQSAELKELNRVKDKFFSIISHDLRSPISAIGGISILIKESIENDNKALLHEITDYIDQTVVSISGLLENLLSWALSQQGKFPFIEESINIKILINEVVKAFSTIAISKNISINLDLQNNLYISGDSNSLMLIIRNLLSNAFKYTATGGTISITSMLNKDGLVEISLADTGIGIPPEKISDIFELKEDKSTRGTEREKGFGLGLNLVYEFVKLNKGKIQVNSTVGIGTNFILHFPLNKEKKEEKKPKKTIEKN